MENNESKEWTLWYSVEWLREQVENITAAIASRRDEQGRVRDELIMTADRDELFRRFMRNALNDVRCAVAALVNPEHGSDEAERETTIHIHLNLRYDEPKGEVPAVVRALDDMVREYLVAKIVWSWLRLVNPQESQLFAEDCGRLLKEIEDKTKASAWKGVRRRYHYY